MMFLVVDTLPVSAACELLVVVCTSYKCKSGKFVLTPQNTEPQRSSEPQQTRKLREHKLEE